MDRLDQLKPSSIRGTPTRNAERGTSAKYQPTPRPARVPVALWGVCILETPFLGLWFTADRGRQAGWVGSSCSVAKTLSEPPAETSVRNWVPRRKMAPGNPQKLAT